uniref:Uncharacterized protein n=1 Tax=Oryza barthii TaxID=65489 RepID=A0A0D3G7R7_9ORYZ
MGTTRTGSGGEAASQEALVSGTGRWMHRHWPLERRRHRRRWPLEERRRRKMAHGRVVTALRRWCRVCAVPGRGLAYAARVCVGTVAQWRRRRA